MYTWRVSKRVLPQYAQNCIQLNLYITLIKLSHGTWFPTMWYVRLAKPQISLCIRTVWSEPLLAACLFYEFQATDRISFGVPKLKRDCTGSSELTLDNLPHCWISHVAAAAHYLFTKKLEDELSLIIQPNKLTPLSKSFKIERNTS